MSDSLLVVLPIISPQYADACIESIKRPDSAFGVALEDVLVVDNTRDGICAERYGLRTYRDPDSHQVGVARSWNIGAREVLDGEIDYLVLLSSTVIFGPELHTTWLKIMQDWWGAKVIECDILSWKLIALHRSCFEKIGLFAADFYPAYVESVDWCTRLRLVGWEHGFVRKPLNAMSQGHGLHIPMVACPWGPLNDHYIERWGGPKGEETFVQPYGTQPIDYFTETPIPELAVKYGLGERGVGWW